MVTNHHQFAITVYRDSGETIGPYALAVDWSPARECARLATLRRSRNGVPRNGAATVLPLWDKTHGEPFLSGVRLRFDGANGAGMQHDFPLTYFHSHALAVSTQLAQQGRLDSGEKFRYVLLAYPSSASADTPALRVKPVDKPWPVRPGSLDGYARSSNGDGADLPVFIPASLLGELKAVAARAGDREVGGTLIGHLRHDPSVPEAFLELTGHVLAEHAREEHAKLTFTRETWTALQEALDRRDDGSAAVGWWHYHPYFCRDCPPEKRKDCSMARDFFSSDDCRFHRTVFPRAYSVALVLSAQETGIHPALYGWREGRIVARAFDVVGNLAPQPVLDASPTGV